MTKRAARGLVVAMASLAPLWWGAGAAGAQAILIQGRVLERANLEPVPGASIRIPGRTGLAAITDGKGLFTLSAPTSAVREPRTRDVAGKGEPPTPPGRRNSAPLWSPDGSHDAAGRAFESGTAGSPREALAKAAAATVEITCAGLVTRQVPAAKDTLDLGDIVLEYPPRKFDLGVKPIYGAIPLFDGTRAKLDAEWEHWMGSYRLKNGLGPTPIVWKMVPDPVDTGMTMQTCCRAQWGDEDLVTKRKFRDFQLHVEFNLVASRAGTTDPANSGVYIQSLYEIQIRDDYGKAVLGNHDAGSILNETAAPVNLGRPKGQWQAYDITYRAARFKDGARSEKARLTLYWNGKLVHKDKETANEHNVGISSDSLTDAPRGLKLQSEGHDVRFRNVWLKPLELAAPNTDLGY
jgi:hypothetical protein